MASSLNEHEMKNVIKSRLGVEIVREQGSEIYLNPICHQSQSGEALQVNTHTGRWNCKACQSSGVKGDGEEVA